MALLVLASVGCGASEHDRVERVFHEWLVAAAANDHQRMCALMTTENRTVSIDDCAAQLRRSSTPATPRQTRNAAEAQIANVEIDGDTATAFLRLRGCTVLGTETEFRRTADGQWRYAGPAPTFEDGPGRGCLE